MENTIENATTFYKNNVGLTPFLKDKDNRYARMMFEYSKSIRPATVSEEEIDTWLDNYGFRVPYDGSNEFYDKDAIRHAKAGIEWALGRQTRIVLPDEFHSNPVSPYRDGWNACLESIRSLNPSATFVTEQKEGNG